MTSSNFKDHEPKKQFSKSGVPLHMLDDIQYMEFAMEFPEEIINLDKNDTQNT